MAKKNSLRNRLRPLWSAMVSRCHVPEYRDYFRYGARGITVCEEWRNSYEAFEAWAVSTGYRADQPNAQRSGLSIERKENNGPYSPDNCTWATRSQQAYNRRTQRLVTAFGETKHISDWPNDPRCIVPRLTLRRRLATGVDPESAMTFPKQKGGGALKPGGNKLTDIIRRHSRTSKTE